MNADTATAAAGRATGRPARPAGYWERIDRLVDQAPPLDDETRARLRVIFQQTRQAQEAA